MGYPLKILRDFHLRFFVERPHECRRNAGAHSFSDSESSTILYTGTLSPYGRRSSCRCTNLVRGY